MSLMCCGLGLGKEGVGRNEFLEWMAGRGGLINGQNNYDGWTADNGG
jgi:hypothetical protein